MRRRYHLAAVFPVLVLLSGAVPESAFAFCFSFGSNVRDRPPYGAYLPPYPGFAAPVYPAYGYSPVPPAHYYNNIYYPLAPAYVTPPPGAIRK